MPQHADISPHTNYFIWLTPGLNYTITLQHATCLDILWISMKLLMNIRTRENLTTLLSYSYQASVYLTAATFSWIFPCYTYNTVTIFCPSVNTRGDKHTLQILTTGLQQFSWQKSGRKWTLLISSQNLQIVIGNHWRARFFVYLLSLQRHNAWTSL